MGTPLRRSPGGCAVCRATWGSNRGLTPPARQAYYCHTPGTPFREGERGAREKTSGRRTDVPRPLQDGSSPGLALELGCAPQLALVVNPREGRHHLDRLGRDAL